jgi:hypothetical protein
MSLLMLAARQVGALGEPPPRRLTRRLLSPLGPFAPRGAVLDAAALLAHFGFGAAMGAVFSALPARARSYPGGALFGVCVWAVNYAGWLPQAGLMPRPSDDRLGRPTSMVAAHVVFGTALAATQRALLSNGLASGLNEAAPDARR